MFLHTDKLFLFQADQFLFLFLKIISDKASILVLEYLYVHYGRVIDEGKNALYRHAPNGHFRLPLNSAKLLKHLP